MQVEPRPTKSLSPTQDSCAVLFGIGLHASGVVCRMRSLFRILWK